MTEALKPIVVAGGGFTGLFTALHLRQQKCSRPIILIDQQWRFIFQPLLYELLTSEVKLDLAWPRYDELLAGSDIVFIRDRKGKLIISPSCQLPEYPEVFAGGDCAVSPEDPQPALAQVAYQQAKAIATNIKARCEGKDVKPAKVSLRGTLLKLGMGESVAEIYNRFEVKGKAGHLIRQATYLEMLPTPLHNFKATTEWLTEDIFEQFISS